MKLKYPIIGLTALLLTTTSCDSFLGQSPDDNRVTQFKSYTDVAKLLNTAYESMPPMWLYELSSDNIIETAEGYKNQNPFLTQGFYWEDVTERTADSPYKTWSSCYESIRNANFALAEIDRLSALPGQDLANLEALRAEAYLCRAYAHFVLINTFSEPYDPATAKDKLGVPYIKELEKTLNPKHPRPSLEENYKDIEADILKGVGKVDEKLYGVAPKYHFNQRASYALAARFYIYARRWDDAIKYANLVLSATATKQLRDYKAITKFPSSFAALDNRANAYVSAEQASNLLIQNTNSSLSAAFGMTSLGISMTHSNYVSKTQTIGAEGAWGAPLSRDGKGAAHLQTTSLISPYFKCLLPKYPSQFQTVDRVSGSGYRYTTYVPFTTDMLLLERAEAYIHKHDLASALRDMNAWLDNFCTTSPGLTEAKILSWNTDTNYSEPEAPTPRNQLKMNVADLSDTEISYLNVLLHIRRIETLFEGHRWQDVRRYGIELTRSKLQNDKFLEKVGRDLTYDDPRRAFQLPQEVIAADMKPNRQ